MSDIATLGIAIDATQVTAGATKFDAFTAAGAKAEAQTGRVSASTKQLATALQQTGGDLQKATALLVAQADAATANATAQKASATAVAQAQLSTAQTIASATGITQAAIKSAQASYGVFAQSLAGQSAIAAAAVEDVADATVAAAGTMAESLGALGSSAVQAAAVMVESEEAMAAAAVESAATTVAAHGAVSGSSTTVRESLTLLREASVGNFTRMAGSATILAQALGVLNTVLLPLAGIAVAFGAAFEIATNQINSGTNGLGDLTTGLGLSADQLDKVKDRYVTFGDTVKAVFQVLWADISSPDLAKGWQDSWNLIADVAEDTLAGIVGTVIGSVNVIEEAWKAMPTVLGGQGTTAGIDFAKAFQSGIDTATNSLNKFYSDVSDQAGTNALQRILKEAGNEPSSIDSASNQAARQLQQIQDQTTAYAAYNAELIKGQDTLGAVTEQEKTDSALKSTIAKIESDENLTLTQKNALINALRDGQTALNQAQNEYGILTDSAKAGQQLSIMERQLEVLGQSNVAQAQAVALLKAQQELQNQKVDPNSAAGQQYIQTQLNLAAATANLKDNQDDYNKSLSFTSTYMDTLNTEAQSLASTMQDAFGNVGKAISDMTAAFGNYATQQAKIAESQAALDQQIADNPSIVNNPDFAKRQILLMQQKQATDVNYYASVLDASKEFFSQNSAGYKLLQAAEEAYRAYQLAASIQAIVQKSTEATATVAADTTTTASGVMAGAAQMFADLGPFAFPTIAAMIALMAGLGYGSSGSASTATPVDPAKQLQAAQGTGTVLGDATQQSDSIAKSLDDLTKDVNTDLEYTNQMVVSLKSIDSHISDLTTLLAQQLQVGGYFDTSNLGLGSSSSSNIGGLSSIPIVGSILGGLFGSSSTSTTLLDQGIQVAGETIGQAISDGVQAAAYQTVQTTKKSSALFGLISSSSTSTKTTDTALPSDFTDQISDIVSGLRDTVLDAANQLGIQGAQQVIDSLSLNIGQISFKDMTGDQIQDALNAVFSKLGDQIATAAVPQITALQQAGEGALDTLSRLANEYTAVDDAAKTVGFSFSQVGVDSLAARDALVQASGGLDNFTSQASYFVQNFLTNAQQLAPVQAAVTAEMTSLGYGAVTTKAQFVALVQSLDVSTQSGAQLYAELMNVAPAFEKVADAASDLADQQLDLQVKILQNIGDATDATNLQRQQELATLDASLVPLQKAEYATEDLNTAQSNLATATTNLSNAQQDYASKTQAVTDAQTALNNLLNPSVDATTALNNAHSDLANAYNSEAQALQNTISQFSDFNTSLTQFLQTLSDGDLANNDALRQYAVTRSVFEQTAQAAASGDQTAIGNLQQAGEDFLNASKAASATDAQYNGDLAAVRDATQAAAAQAQQQVSAAQEQLDALNASVAGLNVLNNSVLSVKDAIDALSVAQSAVDAQNQQNIAAAQAALAAAQTAQAASFNSLTQAQQAQISAANANSQAITNAIAALQNLVGTSYGDSVQSVQNQTMVEQALGNAIGSAINNMNSTVSGSVLAMNSTLSGQLSALTNVMASAAQAQQAAAAQAQAAQAAAAQATQIQQATAAYNAQKAVSDNALNAMNAAIAALGVAQAPETPENIAAGQPESYPYYTYYNDAAGQAAVQAAQQATDAYVAAFDQAYSLYKAIPGHATGLTSVPFNNYLANLHEGEAVLSRADADQWRNNRAANDNTAIIAEIRAMRDDMQKMNTKIEKNTRDTTKVLKNVTQGGNVLMTKAAS